jgi:transcription antitermination factor NusG
MEKLWYVIYTKSNCEKKVASLLTKYNIDNYCPLNKTIRQWADRKKVILAPLFTSYVFVNICPIDIFKVRQVSSDIINFVYWLGKPALVRADEIEQIRQFLEQHMDVKLEKKLIHVNDKIKILNGPFKNMEGNVKSIEHNKIKLILPSLGYIMIAETTIQNVQVVQKDYQLNRMVS